MTYRRYKAPREGTKAHEIIEYFRSAPPSVTTAFVARECDTSSAYVSIIRRRYGFPTQNVNLKYMGNLSDTLHKNPEALDWLHLNCPQGVTFAEYLIAIVRDLIEEEKENVD